MVGTYLARADLRGARLAGAHLEGVDLRAANLLGVVWADPALPPATLSLVDLRGARVGADLPAATGPADMASLAPDAGSPTSPPPPTYDDALLKLLSPLLDRPNYRAGVVQRMSGLARRLRAAPVPRAPCQRASGRRLRARPAAFHAGRMVGAADRPSCQRRTRSTG